MLEKILMFRSSMYVMRKCQFFILKLPFISASERRTPHSIRWKQIICYIVNLCLLCAGFVLMPRGCKQKTLLWNVLFC